MNSERYTQVLHHRAAPQAAEWFQNDWIYQQDNAPCHTSKVSKQCMADLQFNVLDWPSNSPELNPIEKVWAVLKNKLRQNNLTSKSNLIAKVLDECVRNTERKALFDETCTKLIDSMPARIEALCKAKGDHTKF